MRSPIRHFFALGAVALATVSACDGVPAPADQTPPTRDTASEPPESPASPTPVPLDAQLQVPAPREPHAELTSELRPLFRMINAGRMAEARQLVAGYVPRHPDDATGHFLLGLTYHKDKRYGAARPHFERAIELDPDFHPTHYFHGWCLYNLGQLAAARDAFTEHLQLSPDYGDSHFGLGLIAFDEDRLEDAERQFRTSIKLQPKPREESKAHARLADIHIRRNELAEARAELVIATELYPPHYTAYYKLHTVLTRLGETEQAEEAYRQYQRRQQEANVERGKPLGNGS